MQARARLDGLEQRKTRGSAAQEQKVCGICFTAARGQQAPRLAIFYQIDDAADAVNVFHIRYAV
jgi:hypothetical protein